MTVDVSVPHFLGVVMEVRDWEKKQLRLKENSKQNSFITLCKPSTCFTKLTFEEF